MNDSDVASDTTKSDEGTTFKSFGCGSASDTGQSRYSDGLEEGMVGMMAMK